MTPSTLPPRVDMQAATALLFSSEARSETFSVISAEDLCAIVCTEYDRCSGNLDAALDDVRFELAQYPETAPRHYSNCAIAASRLLGVQP